MEAREKILSAYDLPEDTETIMLRGVVSRKKTTGAYAGGRAAAVKRRIKRYGKTDMETGQYALSAAGGHGEHG